MAIITMIMISSLVAILVIYFSTVEEQEDTKLAKNNVEVQEGDRFSKNNGSDSIVIGPDLEEGQTSGESGILEIEGHDLNLPSDTQYELPEDLEELDKTTGMEHQVPEATVLPTWQMASQQTIKDEAQSEILKNGLKIAGLVISVSTTGIVSFLIGVSGNQSSSTAINKLHFKAVILSMCASFLSAIILLILSTLRLKFSCLFLTVRIIIWISTGLMTLEVVLLIAFYSHMP